jgi:hypothetical protein
VVSGDQLDFLVGLELSGVSFVRDYVEFLFDGPVLRVMSEPEARLAQRSGTFPNSPFRDVACALIGSTVSGAGEHGNAVIIVFDTGGTIRVPLFSEDAGPEVVHFVPWGDGAIDVAAMRIWENRA